ncbi:FMN-dependent NADH-azoreductase [Vreelandella sp. EE27]
MSHVLHMDISARPGIAGTDPRGSHSRYLSHRFVERWQRGQPQDAVTYRDLGQHPPSFIDHDWIASAFTPEARRKPWMNAALAESDELVDELIAADLLVIGTPLYNFGMPAPLKAWVDQVIRAGRTVDIDTTQPLDPYTGTLSERERHVVILAARGGMHMAPGEEMAHMNHLETHLATALEFMGITRIHTIAIEGQEAGGEVLAASIAEATRKVARLVDTLQERLCKGAAPEPV